MAGVYLIAIALPAAIMPLEPGFLGYAPDVLGEGVEQDGQLGDQGDGRLRNEG